MKCNKKLALILILVLVIVPFNVMALEPSTGENYDTTDNEIITPEEDNNISTEETPTTTDTNTDTSNNTSDSNTSTENNNNTTESNTNADTTEGSSSVEVIEDPKEEEVKEEIIDKEETTTEKVEEGTTEKKEETMTTFTTTQKTTPTLQVETKRVEISILNESGNKILEGVKFQIEDEDGNVLYDEETDGNVFVIEEMELGKYYLVQKSVPEGYEKKTDKVEFIVDETSEIVEVEVMNVLAVKVPDTFGMEATLLSSVAMFDIALGIGIIVYVKKNKIKK